MMGIYLRHLIWTKSLSGIVGSVVHIFIDKLINIFVERFYSCFACQSSRRENIRNRLVAFPTQRNNNVLPGQDYQSLGYGKNPFVNPTATAGIADGEAGLEGQGYTVW